jgi:hypothetical protein
VDGIDDFGVVGSLEVDRGHAEVGVTELVLDHVQGDAFACHLDRIGMAELVRREASAHAGLDGEPP